MTKNFVGIKQLNTNAMKASSNVLKAKGLVIGFYKLRKPFSFENVM